MPEGGRGPIQVRAQVLRDWQGSAEARALRRFVPMSDEAAERGAHETRGRGAWRQADVRRAIAAAEKAGLPSYRVEIAPDGTITIVVGAPPEAPEG